MVSYINFSTICLDASFPICYVCLVAFVSADTWFVQSYSRCTFEDVRFRNAHDARHSRSRFIFICAVISVWFRHHHAQNTFLAYGGSLEFVPFYGLSELCQPRLWYPMITHRTHSMISPTDEEMWHWIPPSHTSQPFESSIRTDSWRKQNLSDWFGSIHCTILAFKIPSNSCFQWYVEWRMNIWVMWVDTQDWTTVIHVTI